MLSAGTEACKGVLDLRIDGSEWSVASRGRTDDGRYFGTHRHYQLVTVQPCSKGGCEVDRMVIDG